MDLSTLKDLGIAGITVGAMSYICLKLVRQLEEARRDYQSFVKDNNHTTTELVREATETMTKINTTIQIHNEISKELLNRIQK